MDYTVKQLSDLSGISARTLRFYDKIDLLKPERINASGYRIYGSQQVDLLQQILFFRELGFSLKNIRRILHTPDFNVADALTGQHRQLMEKKKHLEQLIATVEKTLAFMKGEISMTDREKFEGFKRKMINQNEQRYGKEIREKFGKEAVEQSYKKFGNLTREEYKESEQTQDALFSELKKAMENGNPVCDHARNAAALHKKWLSFFWSSYSKEAHVGLVRMYVEDPRFTAYYDNRAGKGAVEFLQKAVLIYTGAAPSKDRQD